MWVICKLKVFITELSYYINLYVWTRWDHKSIALLTRLRCTNIHIDFHDKLGQTRLGEIGWQCVTRNCLDHKLGSRISRGSARTLLTLPRESRRCWNYSRYNRCVATRIYRTCIVHWRTWVGKRVSFHRCRDLDARLMRIIIRRDTEAAVIQLTMDVC